MQNINTELPVVVGTERTADQFSVPGNRGTPGMANPGWLAGRGSLNVRCFRRNGAGLWLSCDYRVGFGAVGAEF